MTRQLGVPFINADDIAYAMSADFESVQVRAGKAFLKKVHQRIQKGASFAIESTLSGKTMANSIRLAKQQGFRVHIHYLFLHDPKANIERIQVRVKAGGHFVPDRDVIRRFYRSMERFWGVYRCLCDRWVLFYNASEQLTRVASGNKSDLKIFDPILMDLFLEQIDEKI